jgi:NADH-quinone oxidoreductase subunit F
VDLHVGPEEPSDEERAVVDGILGSPPSPWLGGARAPSSLHVGHRPVETVPDRSRLLPLLRALQQRVGYVSRGAVNYLAVRLMVPPADIFGVATFYALLDVDPAPPVKLHVCDDVVCRTRGAAPLLEALRSRYGPEGRETAGVVWHTTSCLGQCDRAPAVFVQRAGPEGGDEALVSVSTEDIGRLVDAKGARTPPDRPTLAEPGALVLRRVGRVDPEDLDSYRAAGGYEALRTALRLGPDTVVRWMAESGLQGRGGAAFPTGTKWRAVASQPAQPHYVVVNADESEPGTFKDRVVMERDPFAVVEALTIAGFAVGAVQGYIYVRGEYPLAARRLRRAVASARRRGYLGRDILQRGFDFDIEVRQGAGAYICGEETALFNSLEGRRGEPRNKPPFPTTRGLFGKPTVVNNVETLVSALAVLTEGPEAFSAVGSAEAPGTRLFSVSGAVNRPGVYEVPSGTLLADLLDLAGGVPSGHRVQAVLLGGAAGALVGPEALATPLTPSAVRAIGATLGSGVVVVFDDTVDLRDIVRRIARFFRDESCGQCVPCRIGTVRQEELVTRLTTTPSPDVAREFAVFSDVAQVMRDASICGLGQTAPSAIESAFRLGVFGRLDQV